MKNRIEGQFEPLDFTIFKQVSNTKPNFVFFLLIAYLNPLKSRHSPGKSVSNKSEELQRSGGDLPVPLHQQVQLALRLRAEVQERHQHTTGDITEKIKKIEFYGRC